MLDELARDELSAEDELGNAGRLDDVTVSVDEDGSELLVGIELLMATKLLVTTELLVTAELLDTKIVLDEDAWLAELPVQALSNRAPRPATKKD
jgi:hypothetical protein